MNMKITEEKPRRKIGDRRRTSAQRLKRVLADTTPKHLEQLTKQARALAGEEEDEDDEPKKVCLDDIHSRLSGLKVRHEVLRATLTFRKASGLHERLLSEFGQAAAYELDSDSWNDDIITTLQERGRSQHSDDSSNSRYHQDANSYMGDDEGAISYQIGGKVVSSMTGGRICIRFDTSYAGQHHESYFCVLACRPSDERLHVSEHSIPFFLPLREVEKSNLSSSCTKFIDCLSDVLQAYVSRREQVNQLKIMKGDKIQEVYHSLSYNLIELLLDETYWKVGVSLAYDNPKSELPTRSVVMAWPHSVDALPKDRSSKAAPSVTAHRLFGAEDPLFTKYEEKLKPSRLDYSPIAVSQGEAGRRQEQGFPRGWSASVRLQKQRVLWILTQFLTEHTVEDEIRSARSRLELEHADEGEPLSVRCWVQLTYFTINTLRNRVAEEVQ
ncbi:hypothetical protein R1flu_012217 [Riccia fluitans]|uniref:Centromere protein O n=1 Tax=Riccia fluitans TaxID=41844 RepID=A0ABD1ZAY8_9MARC